ncbi:MAG: AI-2E family transporter [Phocaeicola sp.]
MAQKAITFDRFIRGVITGGVFLGLFYTLNLLSGVLLPFFVAWLLAYLLYPMVHFFQEKLRLKSRTLSIIAVLIVVTSVLTAAFFLLVPPMVDEFSKLKDLLAAYFVEGSKQAAIPGTVANFIREHINMALIHDVLTETNLSNTLRDVLPKFWSLISQSFNAIVGIFASFVILLYLFFILQDYESIAGGWLKFIPVKYRAISEEITTDVKNGMNRYFRGQALVAFLVGILFSIGFLIIDFPLAIGLGLFIGLLNMIPYFQLIGLIPTVLLALLKAADTQESFGWILFCALLVFCVVQVIQDAIIVPKVMGKITGLNPAIILLSLSIWGSLMGVLGMIIALPCTSLLIAYYQRYIKSKDDVNLIESKLAENECNADLDGK